MAKGLGIVAAILAIAFTGFVHAKIEPKTDVDRGEAFVPEPQAARIASLGFEAVAADYYWLQAIQAVGGMTIVDEDLARHLGKLIDVVTTLDPWVGHPYRFAAIWMTEGEANVRTAIDLLHRGIEHHPDEWRNWFYLGFNHFYYLGENAEAADALETASNLPGSPVYLPRLVARLRAADADIEVAAVFLREMMAGTDDEERKAGYQAGLDEIEVEMKARFLDRARAAHQKLTGADITGVEDLVSGPNPMLESLPGAAPDALPEGLRRGSIWIIDGDGRIVSSYYGARYEVHYSSPGGHLQSGLPASENAEPNGERAPDAEREPDAERAPNAEREPDENESGTESIAHDGESENV